ncbi:uncharacterized protein BP5553_06620 [Venustampulla echinocandica]|uniref:Uncharacterized protein n=1 Tax=Venustampulla echinocandica TaxID=2656787 RepID=A0A370TKF5_9HELO|nr:uncharacterized protein BP5553_06620 [Venustampulla echinocandica]RDL36008.1 hypothetical protein BP5553_06620 [Venustampulla echinocandica]
MWAAILSRPPTQRDRVAGPTYKILKRKSLASQGPSEHSTDFESTNLTPLPVGDAFRTTSHLQVPNHTQPQSSHVSATEISAPGTSKVHSVPAQARETMSQINNTISPYKTIGPGVVDSLERNPDLPSKSNADGSPKSVSITPKSITYTTVGSLVDPSVKHNFSAPNRLQREGSGRQPLMSMGQRGQYEYHQPPQSTLPPLLRANALAYAKHIANSPYNKPKLNQGAYRTPNPISTTTPQERMGLTDQEMDEFRELQRLREVSGNMASTSYTPTPSSSSRLSVNAPTFGMRLHMGVGDDQARISMGSVPEEDNIIIQQQVLATDNAYTRLHSARNTPRIPSPEQLPEYTVSSPPSRSQNQPGGEMNQGYRFPRPSIRSRPTTHPNPLLAASASQSNADHSRPPRYPRPLTAGPPGQRQYPAAITRPAVAGMDHVSVNTLLSSSHMPPRSHYNINLQRGSHNISSREANYSKVPAVNIYGTRVQPPIGHAARHNPGSKCVYSRGPPTTIDTLPPHSVAQYYPYGMPSDMAGVFTPLSESKQKEIDDLTLSAEEKNIQRKKQLDDMFYSGQRQFATMEVKHYFNELAKRPNLENKFGPIAPPKSGFHPGLVAKKPITEEEMGNMTVAEAAKPFIEAAFGTLLSYAEEGPASRKVLSGFAPAPHWQIDDSNAGIQSYFGGDWGLLPPRFDRDHYRHADF